jgi:hypothetical protein
MLLYMNRVETQDVIEVQRSLKNIESSCQLSGACNLEAPGFLGNLWVLALMFVETLEKFSFLYAA